MIMDKIIGLVDDMPAMHQSLQRNPPTQIVATHMMAATCLNEAMLTLLQTFSANGAFDSESDLCAAFMQAHVHNFHVAS